MTHPALHSVSDAIEALEEALKLADLPIIQRQILTDMRDDLHSVIEINTFADVCELANEHAKRGYY
ncbi:hypothetical protein JQX09_22495 [Sulfitobacter pseudonitzschiae]|uniref:Uncharacterized protein n=1 Tax=Pseudosulfitobacter pseudonitzschiae TaxID=1402135 RepID=A0A9Q2RZG7_9RHOB|nr:hypothetical protein [Pseudosulfitobacter pseudonitzschiae]MBM2294693.1 hypothetical protein [Pseudosulfitobacter pseudonitzschiae]MBM2299630.1 hypothetical protein [Pseudosulfitobacter pseudonitzschiae]MBM2304533.1 hypothetical protein [Pseudosulfitobacter pseudonitzschiae]MBM2314304.1 hypothetical protein [Pseudosulfitobacter pseudonitzschiae]MBM2319224.1 hypothetical protein [Pseudosulfitobacter pseudonitzschiae]